MGSKIRITPTVPLFSRSHCSLAYKLQPNITTAFRFAVYACVWSLSERMLTSVQLSYSLLAAVDKLGPHISNARVKVVTMGQILRST